jgi:HAD superfamily hydrolase (TIGR01509 family)
MNGVVVDDMACHEQMWITLAKRHGIALTEDEIRKNLSGRQNREVLAYLFGDRPETELHALGEEKEQAYREAFRPRLAPVPGFREVIAGARAERVATALATSAPPLNIDFVLDGLSLRDAFDVVVTAADVTRSKPDPEIYLLAAKRSSVTPAECLVFEDALLGIEAARRAGMRVVGVTTTHSTRELLDAGCALTCANFREVALAKLRALFPP